VVFIKRYIIRINFNERADNTIVFLLNLIYGNIECLQKNGEFSKINKKFISQLTRAKRTPSVAATVQFFMHSA
jgi:hypothetical protein